MQPESPTAFNKTSSQQNSLASQPLTSQDGFNQECRDIPPSLQAAEEWPDHRYGALQDRARNDERGIASAIVGDGRWLIEEDAIENAPSRDIDYTLTSLNPRSLRAIDNGSQIAPLAQDRSSIAAVPNEILTHALSHLSPSDLAAVSLVSHRFHALVTTPHAWLMAFSRFFPGQTSLAVEGGHQAHGDDEDNVKSNRRVFTRLSTSGSWRSEYILRTRLLRSLARGKPAEICSSSGKARGGTHRSNGPVTRYYSLLDDSITHLHASFGIDGNVRKPKTIHGSAFSGAASMSYPVTGESLEWGLRDPHSFSHFDDHYPGHSWYGLGAGELVGGRNVIDVSQAHGLVVGECLPGGGLFFRHVGEMRGRFLSSTTVSSIQHLGIPGLRQANESICCVWLAKTQVIPDLTGGVVGIFSGSSAGIVTAYSLGSDRLRDVRLGRGEITARWVLSPGVPIIAISVDESYTVQRLAQNRIWAVALNALGELFYLTKLPKRSSAELPSLRTEESQEHLAWASARSVYWNMVEPSRRIARNDPYSVSDMPGSYSPRSSWDGMCLSSEQISAETKEIETFLRKAPRDFRQACLGWDMQRRLEVDFSGDDGNYAGESIVVFECGLEDGDIPAVKRFTRLRTRAEKTNSVAEETTHANVEPAKNLPDVEHDGHVQPDQQASSNLQTFNEEWFGSVLDLGGLQSVRITSTAIDCSTHALSTICEDPATSDSSSSPPHSSSGSPSKQQHPATDAPGQRARFVAAGTATGSILIWNVRASIARSLDLSSVIDPIRIIYTSSPQIASLALTALYLVHGGNDGLVQAWDPLASTLQPIRTLRSRATAYARRRLARDMGPSAAVRGRLFAASAIYLDPDPTVLRGIVGCGAHLWYWSFSSSSADQYKGRKRRMRRPERGSNSNRSINDGVFAKTSMKGYIATEKAEHERAEARRRRHAEHLAGRFGLDLLANEEEMLAYATLLSNESLEQDLQRRQSDSSSDAFSSSSATLSAEDRFTSEYSTITSSPRDAFYHVGTDESNALESRHFGSVMFAEESHSPDASSAFQVPVRYAKSRMSGSPSSRQSAAAGSSGLEIGHGSAQEMADLELALQLSLVEQDIKEQNLNAAAGKGASDADTNVVWPSRGKGRA